MSVVDGSFDHPLELEEKATAPLAGGIMQHGFQCGMVWGASLAAGARAYQLLGPGPHAETGAIMAAQRLVESFRACNNGINCNDITDLNKSSSAMQMVKYFLFKGGVIGCFRMAANYAPIAVDEINNTFSENQIEVSSSPVSCTTMLAQKMGASEMQAVMAAGLAGGIGLCGEACGALGTALWIIGMNCIEEGVDENVWNSKTFQAKAAETIDRFINSSDFEFECSEIVGRKFENIDDHAGYLRDGGCSEIIEALAAQ